LKASTQSKRLSAAVALVAIAALAAVFFSSRLEPARLWYDVIGVDVSNHQGDIDWPRLAGSDVAFAYIKATEGGDFRDRRFQQNWNGAKAVGMPRGAYHYYRQCRTAADQAKNFIAAVPREGNALPPVLDLEHMGPCAGPQPTDIVQDIIDLLTMLEAHFGRRPLIYTTSEFDSAYLQGRLANEAFWARSIFWPPQFRTSQWRIWQYHDLGRRPGVNGPVDLNAFRGSRGDFQAFISGEKR